MTKKQTTNELILYRLDELKKDTQEIKEHAIYTNGKVAEVLNWKLQNQDFVKEMKDCQVDIKNVLNDAKEKKETKKKLFDNFYGQLLAIAVVAITSAIGATCFSDKIIK